MNETSQHDTNPILKAAANVLSLLFNPLLVPTYCAWIALWSTTLAWLPESIRWISVMYTFLFTGILPFGFIALMRFCGRASDMDLTNRRQRMLPYIAGAFCYGAACFYFHRAHAPEWFYMFFAGAGAAIIVSLIVSFRWKISAHGAAMGGLLAMIVRIMTGPYATADLASVTLPCAVIFTGAVCTARLILGKHTLMQTLAGVANGFICVWLTTIVAYQQ